MTMTDPPSGITEFDDFVHTTYIYKLKVPLKVFMKRNFAQHFVDCIEKIS